MTTDPRAQAQINKLVGRIDTEEKLTKELRGIIDKYIIDRLVLWGRFVPQAATAKIIILDADLVLDDTMPVILAIDPGGADRTITAPPASLNNHLFILINKADAAEGLNVEDVDANSLLHIDQNQAGIFICDGTDWKGCIQTEDSLGFDRLIDPGANRMIVWDDSQDKLRWFNASIGLEIYDNGNNIALITKDSEIVHNSLSGFDANKHIDHTAVIVATGTGMSGGGDISANRTLSVDDDYVKNTGDQIDGNLVIDNTATEALLVRKDADGGDIFLVDTTNSEIELRAYNKVYQPADLKGIILYGYDDKVASTGQLYIDAVGDTYVIATGNAIMQATGNAHLWGTDVILKLGDAAGAKKVIVYDSGWAIVATIDSDGNAWFAKDCSALTFTDRTPFYEGDAVSEIRKIKGKDGQISHSTLPEFARKTSDDGRDLGAMISMLTVAIQQLDKRISKLE